MSQVIVTEDKWQARRRTTRDQERRIDCEGWTTAWRRGNPHQADPVKKLVGMAVMPILAIWIALAALMAVVVFLLNGLMQGLGSLFGAAKPRDGTS